MNTLLAIDTATEACSVAITHEGKRWQRSLNVGRNHAEHVLRMCRELLAEAGIAMSDIQAVAFGRGPGSFTGLRIAASLAQGLALPRNLPLIPVSDLAALAEAQAVAVGGHVFVAMDARMGEVYVAAYEVTDQGLQETLGEAVLPPKQVQWPSLPDHSKVTLCGTGWAVAEEALLGSVSVAPQQTNSSALPDAEQILTLAEKAFESGNTVDIEHALPVYLRNKVAETVAERASRQQKN